MNRRWFLKFSATSLVSVIASFFFQRRAEAKTIPESKPVPKSEVKIKKTDIPSQEPQTGVLSQFG